MDQSSLSCITKLKDGSILIAEDVNTDEHSIFYLKQYILDNHYHLFIKIDDFSGGYGWALVDEARRIAVEAGYAFMQVKTVQSGFYEEYDRTNEFYKACGFLEFEVFPELWGEANPCQIYVMSLNRCSMGEMCDRA